MDIKELVSRVRDHYVEQFQCFKSKLENEAHQGSAEVKLIIGDRSPPFDRHYCADFVKNDGTTAVVEMCLDRILSFEIMEGFIGEVAVAFESMCWDDVRFEHDVASMPEQAFLDWFSRWYDPDDNRPKQPDGLSGSIHHLTLGDRSIEVDFGTAEPEAFWELYFVLVECGARDVRISTSRTVEA